MSSESKISLYSQLHYISITLFETINIFSSHIKDATLSKFKGTSL
jgi:hypothetical protein